MRQVHGASRRSLEEAGDTLIEVLVALVVMGMAFAVIVGGIGTAIIGASLQQNQTATDSLVRSAAEKIASPTDDPYVTCATTSTYSVPTPPAGFSVTVTGVAFWNPTTNTFDQSPPSCAGAPPTDSGLQLVTVSAAATGTDVHTPQATTLEIVKRS